MELSSNPSPLLEIPQIGLAVHDICGLDSSFIDEYLAIHQELLPEYSRYAPVMRQRAEKPVDVSAIEKWHQWLLKIQERPVGMIEFLYNRNRNMGILLDFAICPNAREIQYGNYSRLAGLILNLAIQQLKSDANLNGHALPFGMIAEVEHAHLVQKYKEYGFVEFPIAYLEPPATLELTSIAAGEDNFDTIGYKVMHLGVFQFPGHPLDVSDPELLKMVLLTLLEDHYCLPVDHWLVQKISQ